jgi:hypothetical protein
MLGVLLATVSSAVAELADSILKRKVQLGAASYYTLGFLNFFFSALFLIVVGFWRDSFVFSLDSLPTFIPRLLLELLQAQMTIWAIAAADRSAFGPVRTITIPLLLGVDLALGYMLTLPQLVGMTIILGAIVLLLSAESFKTKGLVWLILTAVNAVATISLYKYDLAFNSVEAEQGIICIVSVLYFYLMATLVAREDPLPYLRRPAFLMQSVASGSALAVVSFAYLFAPASVITTAVRAATVLFSILSGRLYFKEGGFVLKLAVFAGIVVGLALLL